MLLFAILTMPRAASILLVPSFFASLSRDFPTDAKLYETLATVEKALIERALKVSDNVQSRAAELLGIGKSGLNQKIKKFNLEVGSKT